MLLLKNPIITMPILSLISSVTLWIIITEKTIHNNG